MEEKAAIKGAGGSKENIRAWWGINQIYKTTLLNCAYKVPLTESSSVGGGSLRPSLLLQGVCVLQDNLRRLKSLVKTDPENKDHLYFLVCTVRRCPFGMSRH